MHAQREAKLFHRGKRSVCCLILRTEFFNQLHLHRIVYNLKFFFFFFNFFLFIMLTIFVKRTYSCRICLKIHSWSVSFYSLMFCIYKSLYFSKYSFGFTIVKISAYNPTCFFSALFLERHIVPKNCLIRLIYYF